MSVNDQGNAGHCGRRHTKSVSYFYSSDFSAC